MTQKTFDSYIEQGREAVRRHPDYGRIAEDATDDFLACAADVIASILHAADAMFAAGGISAAEAESLHARAWRTYQGDFAEIL